MDDLTTKLILIFLSLKSINKKYNDNNINVIIDVLELLINDRIIN